MKLTINKAAGIFDIVASVIFLVAPLAGFSTAFSEASGYVDSGTTESFSIFILLFAAAGLILHIIALVQSRKCNISNTGNVLGIIGYALVIIFSFLISFIAMILTILSAIFTLRQKNLK